MVFGSVHITALFLRLGLPSTPIRYENAALFLRLGLPSTLIRHENEALFLRLGLPSTLIRHENEALFLRLGLQPTLMRHENAALFLRLGLPSTLIRHENEAFQKRSSNRRNLKTLALRSSADGKKFESRTFPKRCQQDNNVISLPEFSSSRNPRWQVSVAFSNSSGSGVDGKKIDAFSE